MSGFVGVVNLDGAPIDPALLERMTTSMAIRGPDARGIWVDGPIGFGHALLRTTVESLDERQPCGIGGDVWITGSIRLDARGELLRRLRTDGCAALDDRPDAELVLHAYRLWGARSVEAFSGDFAFAIWDRARRCVFCARDQLGTEPFFVASLGSHLIVSNTLDCVRAHPAVSSRLNELAIADFLAFGHSKDPKTTAFADIHRLQPAHTLTCRDGKIATERYWTLQVHRTIRYRRASEYVEHFREVLGKAVADRLRARTAAISMSGGIDSASLAAAARHNAIDEARHCDLRAYSHVFDRLIPDREREYATLAARALDLPIHFFAGDAFVPFAHWDDPSYRAPEPVHDPYAVRWREIHRAISDHARIVLWGYGADSLFRYLTDVVGLLREGRVWRLAAEVVQPLVLHRRLPSIGIRTSVRRFLGIRREPAALPEWLDPGLTARHSLASRRFQRYRPADLPNAQQELVDPRLAMALEETDAGALGVPLEYRHPFFDLGVIDYVLSIPPVPWSCDKELLRTPLLAVLPEQIRRRPKAPLAGDPAVEHCRVEPIHRRLMSLGKTVTSTYVDPKALLATFERSPESMGTNLRPLSLEYWLRHSRVS